MKAEDYPEDARNARCAATLEELASYVEELPEDDLNLVGLSWIKEQYDFDNFIASEETNELVSRFGFDYPVRRDEFNDFLSQVLGAEARAEISLEETAGLGRTDEGPRP